jgi:hypothetical protein
MDLSLITTLTRRSKFGREYLNGYYINGALFNFEWFLLYFKLSTSNWGYLEDFLRVEISNPLKNIHYVYDQRVGFLDFLIKIFIISNINNV